MDSLRRRRKRGTYKGDGRRYERRRGGEGRGWGRGGRDGKGRN